MYMDYFIIFIICFWWYCFASFFLLARSLNGSRGSKNKNNLLMKYLYLNLDALMSLEVVSISLN
jgi:hypothetical protein